VELLNQDVKANAAGRRRARSAAELTKELRSYLRRRQRQPEVVPGSLCTRTPATPPNKSPYLPAQVIS
jgi:hypothetical protein